MKIMPFYKMLALATATNSIFSTCLLQNHKEWPVCTKHRHHPLCSGNWNGDPCAGFKNSERFSGGADGEGMTHFRTQRGACRLATHPTISWGRKKGTKGKKDKESVSSLMQGVHGPFPRAHADMFGHRRYFLKKTYKVNWIRSFRGAGIPQYVKINSCYGKQIFD